MATGSGQMTWSKNKGNIFLLRSPAEKASAFLWSQEAQEGNGEKVEVKKNPIRMKKSASAKAPDEEVLAQVPERCH